MRDHYATLGVSPASEHVVIHAAYRTLMRQYHPDANRSAEAGRRAREINEAYATLGDPERRAEYDAWRSGTAPPPRPKRPLGPIAAGTLALVAAGLVIHAVNAPIGRGSRPERASTASTAAAAGGYDAAPVVPQARPSPDAAAESQVELPAPELAEAPAPAPATTPAPAPAAQRDDHAAAAVSPREARRAAEAKPVKRAPLQASASGTAEPPAQPAGPKPSFDCRFVSSRVEAAVCRNGRLASLDRSLALLYSQALGRADKERRDRLLRTLEDYQARRAACRGDACLAEAYLRRMREVSEIMRSDSAAR